MSSCCGNCGCRCGGNEPSVDASNTHLNEVYRKALADYNQKTNEGIEFVRIIRATKQIVSGVMFRSVAEISTGGQNKEYEIYVWEKSNGAVEVLKCQPL